MTSWWTRSREDKRSRGRNNRLVAHLRSLCMDLAESIEGVGEREVCLRSASLLFNRLIFLYFLQHMGLLSGDPFYLQNHLRLFQERQEEGTGFYREFLCPLFSCFDQSRDCSVPLKNLFPSRSIEQTCPGISIPDKVFAQIFTTFDAYPWQLHAGTVYNAGTVTPDILGEFLELGMRPKEMGAYYTPAEITSYIVHNTLLPALLRAFVSIVREPVYLMPYSGAAWFSSRSAICMRLRTKAVNILYQRKLRRVFKTLPGAGSGNSELLIPMLCWARRGARLLAGVSTRARSWVS